LTLVDTNVLLDLAQADGVWTAWSRETLRTRALAGPLLINDVVYAELSIAFERIEELDSFVATLRLQRERTPDPALFLAARAHLMYRRSGGTRTGVLPDFFIGAHAAVAGLPLVTRDPRRYRTYFPSLALIAPDPLPPGSQPG
jgi:predicted nucleic acid-binding protein